MTREEIQEQYLNRVKALEQEFFDFIDDEKGTMVRVCKEGKTESEFNVQQANIYRALEAELIDKGYMPPPEPPQEPEPTIEEILLEALIEIQALKTKVAELEGN